MMGIFPPTYAGFIGYFNRRQVDTAEPPRMQDSEFEREVMKVSQEIVPIPTIPEAEYLRRYSRADVQRQMDEVRRILETQKNKD